MKYSLSLLLLLSIGIAAVRFQPVAKKPNVIFILADDMGYGDLGCFGQKQIQTPNIDHLAKEGMRFTQAYAGTSVCSPSRSSLMTGQHTGHTYIRGNYGPNRSRVSYPDSIFTMAELFKAQGYATGIFGKWGLGTKGSSGTPNKQGFDEFAGYLDQNHAHDYYTDHLDLNETVIQLPENSGGKKGIYTADWCFDKLKTFVQGHTEQPFFIFFATTLPHDKYQLAVKPQYVNKDWPEGEKIYASMVTHLDQQVGELRKLLKQLKLDDNTLIVFTSDNGPATLAASGPDSPAFDAAFFNSSGGLRGIKREMYEGGLREPMIVSWPNHIKSGTTNTYPVAFWDFMPTFAALTGYKKSMATDGLSILPLLTGGKMTVQPGRPLYWEFHLEDSKVGNMKQAVRWNNWKAVRNSVSQPVELYDLSRDVQEKTNRAAAEPKLVQQLTTLMQQAHRESSYWPVPDAQTTQR